MTYNFTIKLFKIPYFSDGNNCNICQFVCCVCMLLCMYVVVYVILEIIRMNNKIELFLIFWKY